MQAPGSSANGLQPAWSRTKRVRELVGMNRSLDEGGAIAIVKLLVDSNADVALFDDAGRTALHYAFDARSAYQVETCAALLRCAPTGRRCHRSRR